MRESVGASFRLFMHAYCTGDVYYACVQYFWRGIFTFRKLLEHFVDSDIRLGRCVKMPVE